MTTLLRFLPGAAILAVGAGVWMLHSLGAALIAVGLLILFDLYFDNATTAKKGRTP